jgi:hypothetical protein
VIALLIALLVGAAIALAIGLGGGGQKIREDNAQQQIDKLIEYVREHRE